MIATDKYVYIHQPKTGGTFVVDSIMRTHNAKWSKLKHLKLSLLGYLEYNDIKYGKLYFDTNKHGGCSSIPYQHQDKMILSTMRNPFDYYVSQFEFGWWRRKHWLKYYRNISGFDQKYATFPNLSFNQYLRLMVEAFNPPHQQIFDNPEHVGHFTLSFIRLFFRDPTYILTKVDHRFLANPEIINAQYPVHFIHTNNLNRQLYDFLLSHHYDESDIAFILNRDRVLPGGKGRNYDQKWDGYYTPQLKELIMKKDRYLFSHFPEFAV